jgi:hypothetical protein
MSEIATALARNACHGFTSARSCAVDVEPLVKLVSLNTLMSCVDHVQPLALLIEKQPCGVHKTPCYERHTVSSPSDRILPVEALYAMVQRVCHENSVAGRGACETVWAHQLICTITLATAAGHSFAPIQFLVLDPAVVSVCNQELTIWPAWQQLHVHRPIQLLLRSPFALQPCHNNALRTALGLRHENDEHQSADSKCGKTT